MTCKGCGGPLKGATRLVPEVCGSCRDGVPCGPPFARGEVGFLILVPDYKPAGPFRSRELAEDLARLWGGSVEETVPVPLEVHPVGGDLVTVE